MKMQLLAMMLLSPIFAFAQYQFKGMVTDQSGHRLDAVSLQIHGQNGHTGSALADSGLFIFRNLPSGTYTLYASLVGYKKLLRNISLPKDTVQLTMQEESRSLGEVTISVSKPVFEHKADRITFNVENSIIASGGTAWDALSKARVYWRRPTVHYPPTRKA